MSVGDGKTVGSEKGDDGLVRVLSRAEAVGELSGGEVLMENGAGGVVESFEKCVEPGRVAQGKTDREPELLVPGDAGNRLSTNGRRRYVTAQRLCLVLN